MPDVARVIEVIWFFGLLRLQQLNFLVKVLDQIFSDIIACTFCSRDDLALVYEF